MGERSDRIEQHIQQERSDCRDNMIELRQKMARSVNWRVQCGERPLTMLGIAFGGGVLLSVLMGGTRRSRHGEVLPDDLAGHSAGAPVWRPEVERGGSAWDVLKVALTAIAVARLTSFVEESIPGFRDEYRKAEAGRNSR